MGNKNMKKIKIEGFTNSSNSQLKELNENLKKISLSKNEKSQLSHLKLISTILYTQKEKKSFCYKLLLFVIYFLNTSNSLGLSNGLIPVSVSLRWSNASNPLINTIGIPSFA